MTSTQRVFIICSLVILVAIALIWQRPTGQPTPPSTTETPANSQVYHSSPYHLQFTYPTQYFLTEKDVGTPTTPQHTIVLAEDTPENREVLSGTATEPREEPPTITIDIYPNPTHQSAEEWIRSSTTWTLSDQQLTPVQTANYTGIAYTWSGLYEGKSTVITQNDYTYVASVTWLTPADEIVGNYQTVLNSLRFEQP